VCSELTKAKLQHTIFEEIFGPKGATPELPCLWNTLEHINSSGQLGALF